MSDQSEQLLADLKLCEMRVWDALVNGDRQADEDALDDAFLGVYPDGFASKQDHTAQLEDGPTIERYALEDCYVLPLGDDHAVFSYRAALLRAGQSVPEAMYVSSIWKRSGDGWVNIFSQDTPADP